MQVSDSQLPLH